MFFFCLSQIILICVPNNVLFYQRQTPTTKDVGKVFIGFQDDACAAVVLDVWDKEKCLDENEHQQLV